jgi:hypothetical protein
MLPVSQSTDAHSSDKTCPHLEIQRLTHLMRKLLLLQLTSADAAEMGKQSILSSTTNLAAASMFCRRPDAPFPLT